MTQTIAVPGVGDVDFPDGMATADMEAAIQKNFPQIHALSDTSALSGLKAGLSGPFDFARHMLSGAAGTIAGGYAGLAGAVAGAIIPGPSGQAMNWANRAQNATQNALTIPTATPEATAFTNAATYPFQKLAQGADIAGGKVADVTGSPALGAVTNAALQLGVPGTLIKGGASLAASTLPKIAAPLMQSALKPTLKNLQNGNASDAILTMLDQGINVSGGGLQKIKTKIGDLNSEISSQIADSPALIDKQSVYGPVQEALSKFSNQVNPNADISKIKSAWEEFQNHPAFEKFNRESELVDAVAKAQDSKISALQDAGRFKTMEVQQANFAKGGSINKAPSTPANEPYINVGVTGESGVTSPSVYPAPGAPRVPSRYSENAQRVPEASGAYSDAMDIVKQRQSELDKAVSDLDKFKRAGGNNGIPVQLAQQLKQGTYRILNKKYGQISSAEDEAQKAIARGLKDQIANAVPDVSGLNAQESSLINARNILERRHLMESNKNPAGLTLLTHNPIAALGFMADRSALVKSLLARAAYSTNGLSGALQNFGTTMPVATGATLSDRLGQQQNQ